MDMRTDADSVKAADSTSLTAPLYSCGIGIPGKEGVDSGSGAAAVHPVPLLFSQDGKLFHLLKKQGRYWW